MLLQPLEVDGRAVRAATGLSRAEFARRLALDPRALQNWEQGRRRPDRAARTFLHSDCAQAQSRGGSTGELVARAEADTVLHTPG